MKGLKTALVGFGKISAALAGDPAHARAYPYATHAQALRDHPDFDWVAVIDISMAARETARRDWGIAHVAADAATLDIGAEIEVAVVATPPDSRPAVLEAFPKLRAVVVEKPLAEDIAAAETFLAACRARGIAVAVSLPRRYDPGFRALAGGGLDSQIGRPMAAFATYGNGLVNNGTHLVDFVRMLLGEIDMVQAVAGLRATPEGPIPGDGNLPFACRLTTGLAVMVNPVRFAAYREVGLDVWGERGRMQIVHEGLTILNSPPADCRALTGAKEVLHEATRALATGYGSALYQVYENLVAVLAGGQPFCPGEEALATMRVIEAVRRSAAAGGRAIDPRNAA